MVKNSQMLFADFPKMGRITAENKAKNQKRVFTGGVRIGGGMYRTDEQVAQYKRDSLRRKMP